MNDHWRSWTLERWFKSLELHGCIGRYAASLAEKGLRTVGEMVNAYTRPGLAVGSPAELNVSQLLLDMNVEKLGHVRIFEKWFSQHALSDDRKSVAIEGVLAEERRETPKVEYKFVGVGPPGVWHAKVGVR
eukprot:CAMPEP_0180809430 /NCGR_PEP_ID=MMETSP1038_2-20121128/64321_1 /TAXON_ID=632150 /ORGANISM="Azadinium spinosum, Strain 3D9" /LENGTH=130 /DNA_ID=CAMNT_0022850601 /DNA_START=107 /DNA_END=495 /DNA_ORIENTATION=-